MSRFPYYRDSFSLPALLSVPIRPISRLILAASSFFCPDSATIETHFHCSPFFCPDSPTFETHFHYQLFFLSRFGHYRDSFSLPALLSVPIQLLSRLIFTASSFFCPDSATIKTTSSSFCPDSATIEINPHCSLFFLSRSIHNRDSINLPTLFLSRFSPLPIEDWVFNKISSLKLINLNPTYNKYVLHSHAQYSVPSRSALKFFD